jgi:hypothetical protein
MEQLSSTYKTETRLVKNYKPAGLRTSDTKSTFERAEQCACYRYPRPRKQRSMKEQQGSIFHLRH